MTCSLCGKEKTLLKKSHIIPDFMYSGLYDEKHFISMIRVQDWKIVEKKPTGIYDRNILCADCDNKVIGKYETYGSKILYGGNPSKKGPPKYNIERDDRGASKINVQNLDYSKFKLFLLSILWKGHISKQEFFSKIDLGPYSEILRSAILKGVAPEENEFEVILVMYPKSFIIAKSLAPARKFRMEKAICYVIHIMNMSILFKVSNKNKIEFFEIGKPRKDGTMSFFLLEKEIAKSFFERTTGFYEPEL